MTSLDRVEAAPASTRSISKSIGGIVAAWLPAIPLFLLAGAFLFAPVLQVVLQSFGWPTTGWTLSYWNDPLTSRGSKLAIKTSLELAAICATIALCAGGPLAWMASR